MVNTKLSDLGSRKVSMSPGPEKIESLFGDGVSKPGDVVGIDIATGQIIAHDEGAGTTSETLKGIVADNPLVAEDTAIPTTMLTPVIIPQSGRDYRVNLTDPGGATHIQGWNIGLSADAGKFAGVATANTAGAVANLISAMANGDLVGEIRWR